MCSAWRAELGQAAADLSPSRSGVTEIMVMGVTEMTEKLSSEARRDDNRLRAKKKMEMATMKIFPGHKRVIDNKSSP